VSSLIFKYPQNQQRRQDVTSLWWDYVGWTSAPAASAILQRRDEIGSPSVECSNANREVHHPPEGAAVVPEVQNAKQKWQGGKGRGCAGCGDDVVAPPPPPNAEEGEIEADPRTDVGEVKVKAVAATVNTTLTTASSGSTSTMTTTTSTMNQTRPLASASPAARGPSSNIHPRPHPPPRPQNPPLSLPRT
jgi:hypothetical protein